MTRLVDIIDPQQTSPDKSAVCHLAYPPHLLPHPLATSDFSLYGNLVQEGQPAHEVLVHRAEALPSASFRPHITVTPLPSANGWCRQPPFGTYTLETAPMPGIPRLRAPKARPPATPDMRELISDDQVSHHLWLIIVNHPPLGSKCRAFSRGTWYLKRLAAGRCTSYRNSSFLPLRMIFRMLS